MNKHNIRIRPAHMFVVMKSIGWVISSIALLALVTFTEVERYVFARDLQLWHDMATEELALLSAIGMVVVFSIVHSSIYRWHFILAVSLRSIEIASGSLFRRQIMIPMSKVSQVAVGRDLRHFLFGLYYLEICSNTPQQVSGRPYSYRIDGLTKHDANLVCKTIEGILQMQNKDQLARISHRTGEISGRAAKDGRANSERSELFGARRRLTPRVW